MEAENELGSLDPGAQEFRPAQVPPPLRLPGPNQNPFTPLLLSPCYPYNLQQQNQQGPLPPPLYPPPAPSGAGLPPPRLPHLPDFLYSNTTPLTPPGYVCPNTTTTTTTYFMTNTHHQTTLHYTAPPAPVPPAINTMRLPPPPSSTPTRALLLSSVPSDVSETIVRRELEVFGDVRAVEMERARREGIVTVHFYDLRAAHAAMEEIRAQHMQQQNRLRIHYTSCVMMSPPGGIVVPAPCPPPAKGLIAGRAVWAQFTFPATDAYPDGHNQGTLVVFNLDMQITTSELRDIFEAFGAVRELRETPMKKHQRFVEFYDVRDAAKALSAMNGKEINGKQVVIEFSRPGGHNSRRLFLYNNNNNNTSSSSSSSNYSPLHKRNYLQNYHYNSRAAFNNRNNNNIFPSHRPQSAVPLQPGRKMGRQSRRGVAVTTFNLPPRALYNRSLLEDEQGLSMGCEGNRHIRMKSSSSDDHTNASETAMSAEAAMGTLTLQGGYGEHESLGMERSNNDSSGGQSNKVIYLKRSSAGSIDSSNGGSMSSPSSGGSGDCSKQQVRQHGKGRVGGKGWKGGKLKKSFDPRFLIKEEAILVSDLGAGSSGSSSSSSRDARTTVMIKNIPNKYSQKLLLDMLDNHCIHCNEQITATGAGDPLSSYDFVYLPIDFNNKCNVGYGFVNMTTPEATLRLYKAFHQQHWEVFNSRKICEVTYARVQGVEALKEHFKNSKFACSTDEYLPVVFSPPRDGRQCLTDPLPIVVTHHHPHQQQQLFPKSISSSMDGGDCASSTSFTVPSSDDNNNIDGEDERAQDCCQHEHDDQDGIDGGCCSPTSTSSGASYQHHHEYHEEEGDSIECFEPQKNEDDVVVSAVVGGLDSGLVYPCSNGGYDITHDCDVPPASAATTGCATAG